MLGAGTSGQVLTSNGASAPTWTTVSKPTDVHYIGTTSIALNRASASQSLTGITSIDGNANIASHLMGGVAGGIAYQSGANTTSMLGAGTSGQVLTSNGASAPTWTTVSKPTDVHYIGNTSIALNRASASQALTGITSIDGNANIASHLMGGVAGGIAYQSGANTTAMLSAGTSGQVLTSNGASAPTWTTISTTAISNSTSTVNVTSASGPILANISGTTIANISNTGITLTSVSTTTNSPVINATQTWNSGSTIFTGIYENITDTASASASKLIDLQVGGVSKFAVDKTGNLAIGTGTGGSLGGLNNITSNNILSLGSIGFTSGIGGVVTQGTSRTTGVTLNKPSGQITLVSAAGSATPASFTVTNSYVNVTDTIIVNQQSGTNLYAVFVTAVATGNFKITFYSISGTASEAPVFNFNVIKGVNA